jgi:hypothetical protein
MIFFLENLRNPARSRCAGLMRQFRSDQLDSKSLTACNGKFSGRVWGTDHTPIPAGARSTDLGSCSNRFEQLQEPHARRAFVSQCLDGGHDMSSTITLHNGRRVYISSCSPPVRRTTNFERHDT